MSESHVSFDDLIVLARSEPLPEGAQERALEHLEECAQCRGEYLTLRVLSEGRRLQKQDSRRRFAVVLAAAVVAVALGIGFVVWQPAAPEVDPSPFPEVAGPASPEGAQPGLLEDAGPGSPEVAESASPDVASLATTDTYPAEFARFLLPEGMQVGTSDYLPRLRTALEDLTSERYDAAVEGLAGLLRERPSDITVAGFLGIARYLDGDAGDDTLALLQTGAVHEAPIVSHAALWYLANLHLRQRRVEQSVAILQELAGREDSDRFTRLAADLLSRLEERGIR